MFQEVRVSVPASVANVGCGFDVFGFAINLCADELSIKRADTPGIVLRNQSLHSLPTELTQNSAGRALESFCETTQHPGGLVLTFHQKLRPGSGLGSSAASAVAAIYAANLLLGSPLSRHELLPHAKAGEKVASHDAHLDNVAPALFGGFQLVRDHKQYDILPVPLGAPLWVAIASPGVSLDTRVGRSLLPRRIPLKTGIAQWANASALVLGLVQGDYDLIGRALKDKVAEPVRSKLIPGYAAVKAAALAAGSIACSISGSGPAVFAFARSEEQAQQIASVMGQTFRKSVDQVDTYVSAVGDGQPQLIHSIPLNASRHVLS